MNNSFKSDTMGTRMTRNGQIYADSYFTCGEMEVATNATNFHKF